MRKKYDIIHGGKDRSRQITLDASSQEYAHKLELVYRAYERSLDLDIALMVVDLSDEERETLNKDNSLLVRIAIYDAHQREDLIDRLRNLISEAESESVRLAAIKELGRTLYPKRFNDKSREEDSRGSERDRVVVYLPANSRELVGT
jgi:hypothetical protein